MTRAVAYAKFNERDIKTGKKIDFEKKLDRLIKEIQLVTELKLEKIYIDIKSKENTEIVQFKNVCEDILANKVDVLFVSDLRGFGVDLEKTMKFIESLKRLDVRVIFVEENIDTFTDIGMQQLKVMMFFENEMKIFSKERNKEARERIKETRQQSNVIKSQKMKEKWQDEDYKKEMSKRIKIGKINKKRQRGND